MQVQRKFPRFNVDIMNITGRIAMSTIVEIREIDRHHIVVSTDARMNLNREYTLKIEEDGNSLSVSGIVESSSIGESAVSPDGEGIPLYRAELRFNVVSEKMQEDIDRFIRLLDKEHEASLKGYNLRAGLVWEGGGPVTESYRVKKISLGGMLIECGSPLEVDRNIPVLLHLPDMVHLRIKARVASCLHMAGEGKGTFEIGLAFTAMPDEDMEQLRTFIRLLEQSHEADLDLWKNEKT